MREKLRTTYLIRSILLIAAAIVLNIALGHLVQNILKWPLYLDSIGTILVGAVVLLVIVNLFQRR